jgi:isoamylase
VIRDDSFLVLFNAHGEERTFTLPRAQFGTRWTLELTTDDPAAEAGSAEHDARADVTLAAHSLMLLKRAETDG